MRRPALRTFFLCMSIMGSGCALGQEAFITLYYSDANSEDLRYFITPAEDGSFCLAKKFTVAPDLDGFVRLKIKLSKPGYVYTSGLKQPLSVYVAPGKNVTVHLTKAVLFGGDLRRENNFVNNLPSLDSIIDQVLSPARSIKMEAALFRSRLTNAMSNDLELIKTSAGTGKRLSRQLVEFASINRMLAILCKADSVVAEKLDSLRGTVRDDIYLKWKNMRASLFVDSLINCGAVTSYSYSNYLVRYIDYLAAEKGNKGEQGDSLELADRMRITEQHLSITAKEVYISRFLASNAMPGARFYRRELMTLYEEFKREYPNSAAISALELEMKKVARIPSKAGMMKKR